MKPPDIPSIAPPKQPRRFHPGVKCILELHIDGVGQLEHQSFHKTEDQMLAEIRRVIAEKDILELKPPPGSTTEKSLYISCYKIGFFMVSTPSLIIQNMQ